MTDRQLIAWSLIALLVLSGVAAVWLAATQRRRRLRRERRDEKRRESDMASRGTLPRE
jgi:hypothetical protein